jgi:hypothetical protein
MPFLRTILQGFQFTPTGRTLSARLLGVAPPTHSTQISARMIITTFDVINLRRSADTYAFHLQLADPVRVPQNVQT